jgi:tRNA 2-thiocytidine biosynthesis protein TtcA
MQTAVATGAKLEKVLMHQVGKTVGDYSLIKAGDRIAVALSGGKDSFSLLHLLWKLRSRAPVPFDLVALTVHNGSEYFQSGLLEAYLLDLGIPFHLERTQITAVVEDKLRPGSPYCSLCARLRRGALYGAAQRLNCNKVALGHHLDDAVETLLMNLLFGGTLKSMPPKLLAENGRTSIIRPLIGTPESLLAEFATEQGFPIIDCGCWLCGKQDHERARMKTLVADVAGRHPKVRRSIRAALGRVQPRFLMDRTLYDFDREEPPCGH